MIYLYLNNYRNFHNTHIPIKDFNFLVGENSTGKSSLLSLIELFSRYSFWRTGKFYDDFVDVRLFSDLVNKKTKTDFFTIGYYEIPVIKKTSKPFLNAIFLTFKNSEGIPYLQSINFKFMNYVVSILYNNKKCIFNFKEITNSHYKYYLNECINFKYDQTKSIELKNVFDSKENEYFEQFPILYLIDDAIRAIRKIEENKVKITPSLRVIKNSFLQKMIWVSPIRTKPEKSYDRYYEEYSPEGIHTPYDLNFNLNSNKFKKEINLFGRKSGLFESIEKISSYKEKFSPFQLIIRLKSGSQNLINVGYGISQVLPIVNELYKSDNESWFAIQQPEIHLHPKAQAAIGELFYKEFISKNYKFLIETHSDFIIDRFRLKVKYSKLNKIKNKLNNNTQILFFKQTKYGNKVFPIDILLDGSLSSKQPRDYRNFFLNESIKLLGF